MLRGDGNTCITSKGHIGTCTTYRSCYPYFKIPDLTIWESWILGNYDTCSFFNEDGRQTFGVCCSNPISDVSAITAAATTTTTTTTTQQPQTVIGSAQKENNYPNWPPPIPTHPPDHAAPTHPPAGSAGSATTSTTTSRATSVTSTSRPTATTWPTKSTTTASSSHWPPAVPTHSPKPTTETNAIDSSPEYGSCGAKNGNNPVMNCIFFRMPYLHKCYNHL